ncbi:hypothetical protein EKK58_09945 [Candidatus Dependentiae bacterium]|nr:MAG: hypothetical protein EKK58_09945 [Candidatus Dependentiae bacterium]
MKKELSRQRLWQIKKVSEGLCKVCGDMPIHSSKRCLFHYIKHLKNNKKWRERNPDYHKEWFKNNPEYKKQRKTNLKKGLTK